MKIAIAKKLLLVAAVLAQTGFAQADVIPAGTADASSRMRRDPGLFDRTDQYCLNKKVNAGCKVPGLQFEGGGPGVCVRTTSPSAEGGNIDLTCEPARGNLDRQVPRSLYQASEPYCREGNIKVSNPDGTLAEVPDSNGRLTCITPAPVADRFCKGLKEADKCAVDIKTSSGVEHATGVCELRTDTIGLRDERDYNRASRTLIVCMPAGERPPREWTPVSPWSKLLQ